MMPQIQRQVPMARAHGGAALLAAQRTPEVWRKQMRNTRSSMMAVLAVLMLILAACTGGGESPAASEPESEAPTESAAESEAPSESAAASADYKACMVSDVGGIDDNSFNENGWAGMEQAEAELGVEVTFLESRSAEDYARNIDQHISDGCDMIITVGFLLGDATKAAAEANPGIRFAIVDFAYDPAIPNTEGLVYSTNEAAMLVGYVSAGMSKSGIMGTFGGINIGGPVTDFMDGFVAGANYYNAEKDAKVRVLGWDPVKKEGSFTG